MKKILSAFIVLLCVLCLYRFAAANTERELTESAAKQTQIFSDSTESELPNIPKQDNHLRLVGEITYPYQKPAKPSASFGVDESRSGILYQANQHVIGLDKDMLLPGMRLYIPGIWSSTGSILNFN